MKDETAGAILRIHAVQHDGVDVDVQMEGRPETLDDFFAGDRLKRLDLAGGAPVVLAEAVGGLTSWGVGGAWNRDGVILFGETRGLIRIAASGGAPEVLIAADASRQERGYGYPQFLPDGNRFLYFLATDDADAQGIYAASLDDPGNRVQVVRTQ
jgi:hypothetical protein